MERTPLNPYELYNTSFPEEPLRSQYKCDICGETIYMYDKFYKFDDAIVCNNQECLNDYASSYLCEASDFEGNAFEDYDYYDK